eukprot:CAMPEP_0114989850 /NCGR_PEP_ID=MMETSP0216-20121206/10434_1 /TAXON_ID=223996 /ORGANISM="Protocruzia adherens, Strain Boccale" /LENGTH=139 /DNA_ID=CAMNT_0002352889 /DNA_START=297 /DNA_END=716 /DNA_ORIENTATION=+
MTKQWAAHITGHKNAQRLIMSCRGAATEKKMNLTKATCSDPKRVDSLLQYCQQVKKKIETALMVKQKMRDMSERVAKMQADALEVRRHAIFATGNERILPVPPVCLKTLPTSFVQYNNNIQAFVLKINPSSCRVITPGF